jgi:hypothetical protein
MQGRQPEIGKRRDDPDPKGGQEPSSARPAVRRFVAASPQKPSSGSE